MGTHTHTQSVHPTLNTHMQDVIANKSQLTMSSL